MPKIEVEVDFEVGKEVFFLLQHSGWAFPIVGKVVGFEVGIEGDKQGNTVYRVGVKDRRYLRLWSGLYQQAYQCLAAAMDQNLGRLPVEGEGSWTEFFKREVSDQAVAEALRA